MFYYQLNLLLSFKIISSSILISAISCARRSLVLFKLLLILISSLNLDGD